MASQDGDLSLVQRIGAAQITRPIERQTPTQDERRKRRDSKQAKPDTDETDVPHDIVEVHRPETGSGGNGSGDTVPRRPSQKTVQPHVDAASMSTPSGTPTQAKPPDRHLDIKV